MKFDKVKTEQIYLKVIKWFGLVVFSILYVMFMVTLFVEKNVLVFLVGVITTTFLAVIWGAYFRFKSRK